jgi:hypothetical protein
VTPSRLDHLISRARTLNVRPEHAATYVTELGRWARASEPEPRRRWIPWMLGAFATAAAAIALVLFLGRDARSSEGDVVRVGQRVAIVAAPSTTYRVVVADRDHTTLEVERGTVTARLYPGTQRHELRLRGGGVEALATGTVYSLTVGTSGPSVTVHEGTVLVQEADGTRQLVEHGTTWPSQTAPREQAAARKLLATSLPSEETSAPADAGVPDADERPNLADVVDDDADVDQPDDGSGIRAKAIKTAEPIDAAPSPKDRWRKARLLRGQGQFEAAVTECIAIADAKDPTWSPIALVEAVRITLGPLSAPERAIELVDRFEREWPKHDLAPEARELRCRALKQLGKSC